MVVRRVLFVFITNGGSPGGSAGGVDDTPFVVGDGGAEDSSFTVQGRGTGADDMSVGIFLNKSRWRSGMRKGCACDS